jgi:chromosome segregation ATPase
VTDNSAALKRARAADSEARLARCESVLRRMVAAGELVSVAEVARRAKVGEKFAYRHPVLKARIDEAKRAAADARTPDLDRALAVERDFWKERAQHLQRRLDGAVKRIAELDGAHVAEERGLVPPDSEAAALRSRVDQLQSTVQVLEARAARGDRDLEAVRKLNRELVRENTRLQERASADG